MADPRRIYPPHITPPYTPLDNQLDETLGRIADRTDAWKAHEAEMRAALAWCQANGNPHKAFTRPATGGNQPMSQGD